MPLAPFVTGPRPPRPHSAPLQGLGFPLLQPPQTKVGRSRGVKHGVGGTPKEHWLPQRGQLRGRTCRWGRWSEAAGEGGLGLGCTEHGASEHVCCPRWRGIWGCWGEQGRSCVPEPVGGEDGTGEGQGCRCKWPDGLRGQGSGSRDRRWGWWWPYTGSLPRAPCPPCMSVSSGEIGERRHDGKALLEGSTDQDASAQ